MAEQAKKLIDLSKKVKINLAKVTNLKICAQVGMATDISGSAAGMYTSGVMQRLFDRLFAVAYEFDDNGSLDAWAFHTSSFELESITEKKFGNYVTKHILEDLKHKLWGGTCYSPAMQDIIDHYYPSMPGISQVATAAVAEVAEAATGLFGRVKSLFASKPAPAPAPVPVATPVAKPAFAPKTVVKLPDPAYILFITDGENSRSDETYVDQLLQANADKQIYWQFIGITDGSRPNFSFIQRMADKYGNVGFYDAGEIDKVSDDELYTKLFTKEFINWYEAARKVS